MSEQVMRTKIATMALLLKIQTRMQAVTEHSDLQTLSLLSSIVSGRGGTREISRSSSVFRKEVMIRMLVH